MDVMINQVKQFSTILNKYTKEITAVELGMFGLWGEMHTSSIATKENISTMIGVFLENIKEVPILVRTPKMIYNYFNITMNSRYI